MMTRPILAIRRRSIVRGQSQFEFLERRELLTVAGDSNADYAFDSADLIQVFQQGKFEQPVAARWSDGDWNRDGRFDSSDLVAAFQEGRYEQGRQAAILPTDQLQASLDDSSGRLRVVGTNRRDQLRVVEYDGRLFVDAMQGLVSVDGVPQYSPVLVQTSNGLTASIRAFDVTQVELYGWDGNDQIEHQFNDESKDTNPSLPPLTMMSARVAWSDAVRITVHGGPGDDEVRILAGSRGWLFGDEGNDRLFGGWGRDELYGGPDHDFMQGDNVGDPFFGADDFLDGGPGNDDIAGWLGNDTLHGGDGRDQLYGNQGDDSLAGGQGNDQLLGSDGDDQLYGNEDQDFIQGDDILPTSSGQDYIDGGSGDDDLAGWLGNDHLLGGEGHDQLYGNDGADTLEGGEGDDRLFGGADNDLIVAGNGSNFLDGGWGGDLLYGGDGLDIVTTGLGNGDLGRDVVTLGAGVNYATIAPNTLLMDLDAGESFVIETPNDETLGQVQQGLTSEQQESILQIAGEKLYEMYVADYAKIVSGDFTAADAGGKIVSLTMSVVLSVFASPIATPLGKAVDKFLTKIVGASSEQFGRAYGDMISDFVDIVSGQDQQQVGETMGKLAAIAFYASGTWVAVPGGAVPLLFGENGWEFVKNAAAHVGGEIESAFNEFVVDPIADILDLFF